MQKPDAVHSISILWAFLITAILAFPAFLYPIYYDQATFMYVGRIWQDGLLPFRDALDTKPPGIFALYALADILFGRHEYSYRILEYLFLCSTIFPFQYIFKRLKLKYGGVVVHFLYVFIYFAGTDFTNIGQVEMVVANISIWYLAFLFYENQRKLPRSLSAYLAGVITGILFLLKQPFAIIGLVYFTILISEYKFKEIKKSFKFHWRQIALLIGGAMSVPGILILYYLYHNAGYDLFYGMLKLPYLYSRHSSLPVNSILDYATTILWNIPILIIIVFGSLFLIKNENPIHKIVMIWAISLIAAVFVQMKFWPYHMIATIPVLAVLITIGCYKLASKLSQYIHRILILTVLVIVLLFSGTSLAFMYYQINIYGIGKSSSYIGSFTQSLDYLNKKIDKSEFYSTFYGGFTRTDVDWLFAQKINKYLNPKNSLQIVEFRPSLYIYTNTKATHKYFFGSLIFLAGPEEGKKMLNDYKKQTYVKHRPDLIVFGLDGPWLVDTIQPLYPGKNGYTLIDTFVSNYHPNNQIKNVTFGIFKNDDLKK